MCYDKNESIYFDVMENDQIFPSKVCHVHYHHKFLFSRTMKNIRSFNELRRQKLF